MKRKIAAILAADIAGYSRLVAEDEEETIKRLGSYRVVFDALIAQYGGRIFNTAGDAVMAEFSSTVEAVRCAVDVQESLKTRNLAFPPSRQMHFRIGISVADVIERDGDLLGDGVNIAARLEGLAEPGGICVSRSVYEQVSNKAAIHFSDIGEQLVKNIPTPVHAYRVDEKGQVTAPIPAPGKPAGGLASLPVLGGFAFGLLALIGIGVWALRPSAPVGLQSAPSSTGVPASLTQGTAPSPASPSVARLTLLTAPEGSNCQSQVMAMNPRFVEFGVELSSAQPVLEIDSPSLCGLAIAGSGSVQARFAPGTVSGTVTSMSSAGRIIFNPTGSAGRLPDIAITGGGIEKIELRRK